MNAGELDNLINVLSPKSTARSTDGGKIFTYTTTIENLWAKVEPVEGKEIFLQNQRYYDVDMKFTARYTSVINTKQVIACDGNIFEIQGLIDVDYAHTDLLILGRNLE